MKGFSKVFFLVFVFAFSGVFALAQEAGGVKGRLRNARGDGIGDVTIIARQDNKDVRSVKSDGKGNFVLDNLAPGVYNFVFEKSGFGTGIKYGIEVKRKKIENLGDRLVLSVDQGTQVIVKGVVFDENGRSVGGANVEIERKQPDGSYKKLRATTSSYGLESLAGGEFEFRFPEGASDFRITVTAKGASASKEISVGSAAVYRLALTLKTPEK